VPAATCHGKPVHAGVAGVGPRVRHGGERPAVLDRDGHAASVGAGVGAGKNEGRVRVAGDGEGRRLALAGPRETDHAGGVHDGVGTDRVAGDAARFLGDSVQGLLVRLERVSRGCKHAEWGFPTLHVIQMWPASAGMLFTSLRVAASSSNCK
jgi:hypothetical protein